MFAIIFILSFTLLTCSEALSQGNIRDSSIGIPLINLSYSFQVPAGDIALRFGVNSNIGSAFLIKDKKNRMFGFGGNFLFGNIVKENQILDNLKTNKGAITNGNGGNAQILLYERGYSLMVLGGKLFSVFAPNPNSGFAVLAGAGFLQHKIRIEVTGEDVPQLDSEYKKGYDRLTNGFALMQFVGYYYLSNRRLINFFGGFEVTEAFTKNRRGYNYDLMARDDVSKTDFLFGLRVGWILPLYKKVPEEYYFY